ncbi:peptide deformylase [Candidatus Bipolaricaulota bacterium]|nr:peptide deformylase [Candidatus Bipolaricaulota bacterium]
MRRSRTQEEIMDIRTFGDSVLRRKAETVAVIDDDIRGICQLMVEVMIRENGVGLAAPQIGISKRIFVLDVDDEFHILINPELVELSEEVVETKEGCLSVPGVDAVVTRSTRAVVEGLNLNGEHVRLEGEGLIARAIQHEMDHLNGNLFLDQLSTARRQSLIKEYQRVKREEQE